MNGTNTVKYSYVVESLLPCPELGNATIIKPVDVKDATKGGSLDRGSDKPIIEKGPLDRRSDRTLFKFLEKGPLDRRSDSTLFLEKGPIDQGSDKPIIEKGPLDRRSDPFPWKGSYRPRVR